MFGLAFDRSHGIAVGGDFAARQRHRRLRRTSRPTLEERRRPHPPRRGRRLAARRILVATGESGDVTGTSWSSNGGRTWRRLSDVGFHTLDCTGSSCWAAGGKGRVAVVTFRR